MFQKNNKSLVVIAIRLSTAQYVSTQIIIEIYRGIFKSTKW